MNWLVNFWFALYIPTALNNISWILYIIFAGISFLAALSTWLFQPETANRSLEEMDAMFDGKTMWVFKDKDLTRVHPRRETTNGSTIHLGAKNIDSSNQTEHIEDA